jgi:hypothetical protein
VVGGQRSAATSWTPWVSLSFTSLQWVAILVTGAWLAGISCGCCITRSCSRRRVGATPRASSPLKEGFAFS